jgi:hypothetical protein
MNLRRCFTSDLTDILDRAPADLVISVKTMMAPMLAEGRAPCSARRRD